VGEKKERERERERETKFKFRFVRVQSPKSSNKKMCFFHSTLHYLRLEKSPV